MKFPLDVRFKTLAIASQIAVRDADGRLLFYVRQKAFKLKEAVTVFADEQQTRPLYRIAADRVFDISARYRIEDPGGAEVGALKRQGMRSFWRANYDIEEGGRATYVIREENPWVKVADGVLESIPILGIVAGYLFHPAYAVSQGDGGPTVLRVVKQPALFEGRFVVEAPGAGPLSDVAVIAVLMMLLVERSRG